MNGAPAPMQFANLQYAQAPSVGDQLSALSKNLGPAVGVMKGMMPQKAPLPGEPGAAAEGPVAPGGNMPLPGTPGSAAYGPAAPAAQPGLMDALRGLSPPQILDRLRAMSANGQQVTPPGMPGSVALQSAGLIPAI